MLSAGACHLCHIKAVDLGCVPQLLWCLSHADLVLPSSLPSTFEFLNITVLSLPLLLKSAFDGQCLWRGVTDVDCCLESNISISNIFILSLFAKHLIAAEYPEHKSAGYSDVKKWQLNGGYSLTILNKKKNLTTKQNLMKFMSGINDFHYWMNQCF